MKIIEDKDIVEFKIEYKREDDQMKEISAESNITIKIGEVSVELTQTEAEQLYNSLSTVLGKPSYIMFPIYPQPNSTPLSPYYNEDYIICDTSIQKNETTTIVYNKV
jgi:hypothetical protein